MATIWENTSHRLWKMKIITKCFGGIVIIVIIVMGCDSELTVLKINLIQNAFTHFRKISIKKFC
jgi:hypothetical protein